MPIKDTIYNSGGKAKFDPKYPSILTFSGSRSIFYGFEEPGPDE
jgi:hypothetical protein